MSIIATPARIIRNTLQHVRRNIWHAITAIMVMTLTLFIASLLALILYTSDQILLHLENKLEVTAFFTENTQEDYILSLQQEIEQTGKAEEVRYISQKEALEIYREQNADTPELLEFVTADILPASLSVSAKQLNDLDDLAQRLSDDERVERIIYQQDVVDSFRTWSLRIRTIGLILSGFLITVTILILLVVVSLNIADFGKEIEIMRLVGASSWYIRWPFILDGMLFGLIASVFSTIGMYILMPYFEEIVRQLVSGISLFPNQLLVTAYVFIGSLILGTILGVVGSAIAIYRHLKV
ncbi:permease-like cell division protein FtsX [candidate division WWE3 bacterium]|uniref:Cell division protein FtsX n=1 Tax=candidate division WWE3 bacterium TaxID=2053526 RepID=A0A955LH30_UNCKA|nr:permease-like cell division protein FtsX [candidate division WWE3 bacterium]